MKLAIYECRGNGCQDVPWMEKMSKQRGMGCAGRHHPPGRADEVGRLVRDKLRRGQNVALRSPGPKDRRSLCSELKEREGSSWDADAKARMLVKKKKKKTYVWDPKNQISLPQKLVLQWIVFLANWPACMSVLELQRYVDAYMFLAFMSSGDQERLG